jgi:ArsR family transcriptional regulator
MIIELSPDDHLARAFRALGDPTRLQIFQMLRRCGAEVSITPNGACHPAGALAAGEVCCRFAQSPSTISHHLRELRLAGLIRMQKRGRTVYYAVDEAAVTRIAQFLQGEEHGKDKRPVPVYGQLGAEPDG